MASLQHRAGLAQATLGAARYMGAALLLFSMGGCLNPFPPTATEQGKTQPRLAERPQEADTVRGAGEPAVVTLPISGRFQERLASQGDPLPHDIVVPKTNFSNVPVTAALQAVLNRADISLTMDKDYGDHAVSILNLHGPLDQVVERVCDAGRVYCRFHNGAIELRDEETFIIEMPPIPADAQNSIADSIGNLAGGDTKVDRDGGNIIYTADMAGQMKVQQYLSQLRRGRPLVVMQLYIWEVRLNDSTQAGIRFDSTRLDSFGIGGTDVRPIASVNGLGGAGDASIPSTLQSAATSGALTLGATFKGAVDAGAIISFLQTQGTVETVSNPQLTFVSGTKSEFSIGGKQNYISGVGQLVGTTAVTGGNSNNTGVGTNTVQTDEIETGISVKINGAYEGGVVFGEMSIEDVTLLGFDRVPSGGTEIQLPRTQERKLSTIIRLRPGDTLLLAGLRSTNDDRSLNGVPTGLFGILPFSSNKSTENREMVIMLRPAIIRFADAEGPDKIEPVARISASPTADKENGVQNALGAADAIAANADPGLVVEPASAPARLPRPAAPAASPVALPASAINANGQVSTGGLQRAFADMDDTPPTQVQP